MLEKLQQHIANKFSFLENKKLLIAISGGVDSVVLTQLFHQLKFAISLAHCNFNLRGEESDIDEVFVKGLGNKLQLKTFTVSFQTEDYASKNKVSTQVAARELRYDWFETLINEHAFDYVLTAHHADDNLETFLINLSRGTGLEGLTGIPEINKTIVRPLLIFSREEIEQYATLNKIDWREDKSNESTKYLRNKIRHQIVPILKEINPNLLDSFQHTIDNLQGSQDIINDTIEAFKKKTLQNSENGIVKIEVSEIKKVVNHKAYLHQLLKEYGFTEWNDIVTLLDAQSGKQVFSKTHRLLKDRTFLLLSEINQIHQNFDCLIDESTSEITVPIHLLFDKTTDLNIENQQVIVVDLDKIIFPLTLRKWKEGDFFYPKGMQGKKKVSKFFKDEKCSLLEKENTWLLCNKNGIIWIVGKRQDSRFCADSSTNKMLKIQFSS
jgi:tRNA(Ile)-lysidine synthase